MKNFVLFILSMLILVFMPNQVQGSQAKNDPRLTIYEPNYVEGYKDNYVVEYNDSTREYFKKGENLKLLMINGTFVKNPNIKVLNSRTLVPIRLVSETMGSSVEWNKNNRTVTIFEEEKSIILTIDSEIAVVNGTEKILDTPAKIIEDRTYVPIRFVADNSGASVSYEEDFLGEYIENFAFDDKITLVTIDKQADKTYTRAEGLAKAKNESRDMYNKIKETLLGEGTGFNGKYADYDSQKISHAGEIGCYYVYTLNNFENYPIFYNKFNGKIFSLNPTKPTIKILNGFPNIENIYGL